jgi:hypothetical protein
MIIRTEQLSLLALGIVSSVGIGFLVWTLYHLVSEAHHQHRPSLPPSRSIRVR